MTLPEIEARLVQTLAQCRSLGVPESQLDDMVEWTTAGEPGVALENLCTQLLEYDVVVPVEVVESLRELGTAMGIADWYWQRLATK